MIQNDLCDTERVVILSGNPSKLNESQTKPLKKHKRCFSYNSNATNLKQPKTKNMSQCISKSLMTEKKNVKPKDQDYFLIDKFLHELAQSCQKPNGGDLCENKMDIFKPKTASKHRRADSMKQAGKPIPHCTESFYDDLPYLGEKDGGLTSNKISLVPRLYTYHDKAKNSSFL